MTDEPSVPQQAQGHGIAQATHGSIATVNVYEIPAPIQEQNRVQFLRRLHDKYSKELDQSLQGAALMTLGLVSKPDAVQPHTRLLFPFIQQTECPLPLGIRITEVYDCKGRELLILGEPGTGKSTLLLDLAKHLVISAQQNGQQLLPVIVPLSTWAEKRPPFQDWLAEQVALHYAVSRQISRSWVQDDCLLPLLDGLDEVPQPARIACIEAITAYLKEHIVPLIVCSRRAEYEELIREQRLRLLNAVVIQPLTSQQVDAYLVQAGEPLAAVRIILHENPVLQDMARTPLILNILSLAYRDASVQDLPYTGSREQQQRALVTKYVECMVERKGSLKHYPLEYTQTRLGWLAQQMRNHNQTVFYLEHLQFDWLSVRQQHTYTWLAVRLPGILIGVLASLVVTLFLNFSYPIVFFAFLQPALLGGFLGSLLSDATAKSLSCQSVSGHARGSLMIMHIITSICMGLAYGLSFGLYPNSESYYELSDWLRDGSLFGIAVGLSCWLLLCLQPSFFPQQVQAPSKSIGQPWQLHRLVQTPYGRWILLVTAVFGGALGLSRGLSDGLKAGLGDGLSTGVSELVGRGLDFGLSYGLISVLISLILVAQTREVQLVDRLHWSWKSLLRSLIARSHLRTTMRLAGSIAVLAGLSVGLGQVLSVGLSRGFIDGPSDALSYVLNIGLINGLSIGLAYGLSNGLSVGLNYGLLVGLFQSIKSEQIEDKDRLVPNQGTRRSVHYSLVVGLISGSLIGLSIGPSGWLFYVLSRGLNSGLEAAVSHGLNYGLSYGVSTGLSYGWYIGLGIGLSKAWLIGSCSGLLAGASKGGLAALRHMVLRILLWRSNTFPLKAPQFLDDATARILLRRIGGGYSFTHRLLLDYFADLDIGSSSTPPTKPLPP